MRDVSTRAFSSVGTREFEFVIRYLVGRDDSGWRRKGKSGKAERKATLFVCCFFSWASRTHHEATEHYYVQHAAQCLFRSVVDAVFGGVCLAVAAAGLAWGQSPSALGRLGLDLGLCKAAGLTAAGPQPAPQRAFHKRASWAGTSEPRNDWGTLLRLRLRKPYARSNPFSLCMEISLSRFCFHPLVLRFSALSCVVGASSPRRELQPTPAAPTLAPS